MVAGENGCENGKLINGKKKTNHSIYVLMWTNLIRSDPDRTQSYVEAFFGALVRISISHPDESVDDVLEI